jgi:hypothetical protein
MKKIKSLTLFLFFFIFCNSCFANETGNTLYSSLQDYKREKSENLIKASVAFGYVIGVHDALFGVVICSPSNGTRGQIVDIVFQYLQENPQLRHKNADELISQALVRFYPCKRK